MQCPECQFDNPDEAAFCCKCGIKFEWLCHECGHQNPPASSFCCKCGSSLSDGNAPVNNRGSLVQVRKEHLEPPDRTNICEAPNSERKCVTVMFSDLTGYTEMSEKLDPEEVKEITSAIFAELTRIIEKYDGFIEKYIGDAILAVFGAKEAFEDSALRAIKAAREIHTHVESISPRYEKLIGRALTMHTGINTGVVVTGEINFEKGTHGLVGDTINTAARLMSVSESGEIIVDHDSFFQTEGYFEFEILEPVKVKGKAEPIAVYRVGKALREPMKLHRLHGLRAELIGRSIEMQELKDAAENLERGQRSIVSVRGTAGTGKSRLVHEFKKTLDLEQFQWFDANAYPYTQNTPYYPLKDILTKAFRIEESDSPEAIQQKIESSLEGHLGKGSDKIPYIGGLFSIEYSETNEVSPDYWKEQLYSAVDEVLKALVTLKPTVICLEDMHWADPSTMELVWKLVSNLSYPLMTICIYRPIITLFTGIEIKGLKTDFIDLKLRELSPSESHKMACSLLKADEIPKELRDFIRDNIDGNPFYVEELINALIDSEALSSDTGQWVLTRSIDESFISKNVQSVVAGRIDRLGYATKRVLQEASVIGRTFLFDILQRISVIKNDIDRNLVILERLDLISSKSIQSNLEYSFKHALTQEVVYNGLLMGERRDIHERIGFVIEELFHGRLPEFYETLAFHFKMGQSKKKAVEYLRKAGHKCYQRYSLKESHKHYHEAYELLSINSNQNSCDNKEIIDLIIEWGHVHNCRSDWKGMENLLIKNEQLIESIENKETAGMFHAWMGYTLHCRERLHDSYKYLKIALKLGEQYKNNKVIGYACAWLVYTCRDIGALDEAIKYSEHAHELIKALPHEKDLIRFTLNGLGLAHYFKGNVIETQNAGKELLEYGRINSDSRCMAPGYNCIGLSYYMAGNFELAIENFQSAIKISPGTAFSRAGNLFLCMTYVASEKFYKAEDVLEQFIGQGKDSDTDFLLSAAPILLGVIRIYHGEVEKGFKIIENAENELLRKGSLYRYAMANCIKGKIFSRIATGYGEKSLTMILKNFGFFVKNVPMANKKAMAAYEEAIKVAKQIGANGILGQAYHEIGRLQMAKRKFKQAGKNLTKAISIFEQTGADLFLKQAQEAHNCIE